MAEQISFLIVGNGIAGMTAAEVLRAEDPGAMVGVIGEDPQTVYFRPALKDYLAERVPVEKLRARPDKYYEQQNIRFLPRRVMRILADRHIVQLQGGGQVKYGKLLVASGAQAASLNCTGYDLDGVMTLRTIEDYDSVRSRLPGVERVVVVGSGTLALETVETLRHRGLHVSHLIRKQTLWSEVLDATSSDLVIQEERRDGVDVQLETEVAQVLGSRGRVCGVATTQGQRIPCELVLIAIGIEPNVDFLRDSGIACRRGILVNQQMRTNVPDIYAAGDVVETINASTGKGRLIGQWYPAIQQARAAAYSMLDILDTKQSVQNEAIYNATFLYGLPFSAVGVTSAINTSEYRALIADPQPRDYHKVLFKIDGVPVGALSLGERKQMLAYKRAIDYKVNLSSIATRLFDAQFDLGDWLDRQRVPAIQLGIQRVRDTAGATVVKQAVPVPISTPPVSTPAQHKSEESMLDDLSPSFQNECFLVHIADPGLSLRIAETPLGQEKLLVGRQPGVVDLVIDEGSVSRQHALIDFQEEQYVLCDLKSLNGTFINEERLSPNLFYKLSKNDVIRLGNIVSFRFLLRNLSSNEYVSTTRKNPTPLEFIPTSASDTRPPARAARVSPDPRPAPALVPTTPKQADTSPSAASSTSSTAEQKLPPSLANVLKGTPALIVLPTDASALAQKQATQIHLLQTGKNVTIGRVSGNDIELADRVASRQHAEVFSADDGFYVRDLGSSNGVFVNQSRITEPYRLTHGDHLLLGTTIILFVNLASGREQTMKVAALPVPPKAPPRPPMPVAPDDDMMTVTVKKQVVTKPQQHYTYNQMQPQQTRQPAQPPAQPSRPAMQNQTVNLSTQLVVCQQCGVANVPSARFCASCSASLRTSR